MASSSPTLDRITSTQKLTIPKMVELLSDLHNQLSTAAKSAGIPAQAGSDRIEETAESSATVQAPSGEQNTDINVNIQLNRKPRIEKLLSNIEYLKEALGKTKDLEDRLNEPIQSIQSNLMEVIKSIRETQNIEVAFVDAISKDIKTLKFQIPSYNKLTLSETSAHLINRGSRTPKQSEFKLPNLYGHQVFDESPAFKEIQQVFYGFDKDIYRRCFLYFSVFPENVVLKQRFLTHWWIGEGLLHASSIGDGTPEDVAGNILKEFSDKGLIVPVKEEQKVVKKRFRVPPLVRSAAITLARKEGFLEYDLGDNPIGKSLKCDRIFLVKGDSEVPTKTNMNLEQTMESIFNVSQSFPDSALEWLAKKGEVDMTTMKVVEWLLKLKKLKVLYLGRWQSAVDEHQIEVESMEFLKGLKKMKELRLLSLQGIFWINELPNSIKSLKDLRVLDLKSCHNLEKLPEGMGYLKKLTHLDVSGCYMLDQMPKSISVLTELRVLKGFVTGMSNLKDLKGLKKLRKLSINTSSQDFPDSKDLRVLHDLGERGVLRNLTIVWGAEGLKSKQSPSDFGKGNILRQLTRQFSKLSTPPPSDVKLPKELEKLEIECLPKEELPDWINPPNLQNLKKLYIRGGKLKDLGTEPWSAEVVRLKYMAELKIEWRNLQKSFPNLKYLQRVKCPKVTFCPCDCNGVWMKQQPQ